MGYPLESILTENKSFRSDAAEHAYLAQGFLFNIKSVENHGSYTNQ